MRKNKIRLFVSSILLSIALIVGGCTAKDAGQQAQQSASQSNLSGEKNDEKIKTYIRSRFSVIDGALPFCL